MSTIHWRMALPHSTKAFHVVDVEGVEGGVDAGINEAALGEEIPAGHGRGGKAAGHADPGFGELANHFAQGGILAADLVHVGHAQVFKGDDILLHGLSFQGNSLLE